MSNQSFVRRTDVVVRTEAAETLVLDLGAQTVHCLSGNTAVAWNATETTVAGLSAATGLDHDAVEDAVAALHDLGLVSVPAGLSRRGLLARTATVGGAAVAMSAVSIALPSAASAASTPVITVSKSCNADGTAVINIDAAGGYLAGPGHTYHVTLVYASFDGTSYTYYTVTFDIVTQGAGKPASFSNKGGTDSGATVSVSTGGGLAGRISVTTTQKLTGALLPADLYSPSKFNGGTPLKGGTTGNIYLQFVPVAAGDPYWDGYTSVVACYTPAGNPPTNWPTPF